MLAIAHRFHGRNSMAPAYKFGKTVRDDSLAIKYRLNTRRSSYRAAVVVSKKVEKSAVRRNRIRRRIYEALDTNSSSISEPYDLIITVYNPKLATTPFAELTKDLNQLLNRAGIVKT